MIDKLINKNKYDDIISLENLHLAWREFLRDKKRKKDVIEYQIRLSTNIFMLAEDLKNKTYCHGGYEAFKINDPKPRDIHKAIVRDRLLHHAIYRILYYFFDKKFIFDSYSCRYLKGTHLALNRFRVFARKVSRSNSRTCWVLKCDVRKFFASIDHDILIKILKKHLLDENIVWLLERVIESFNSTEIGKGLPLGNLTSQLLVNVFMNEFDQYMKHILKVKYYIRYADDFVLLSDDKKYLESLRILIEDFLKMKLKLFLHPDKVSIKTLASGIDFLGWVNFPYHRTLRTSTKKRMLWNLRLDSKVERLFSYLGMLKHGNAHKLADEIVKLAK
jgi:RNA-directed DNA polymerase